MPESFLIRLLATLNEINNYCNTINHGGCGIFAKMLGELLEDRGYVVKYYVVLASDTFIDLLRIDNTCDNVLQTNFYHVVINVDNKIIDSNGVVDINDYNEHHIEIEKVTLKELLKKANWRKTYDPAHTPKIEEILYKNLGLNLVVSN